MCRCQGTLSTLSSKTILVEMVQARGKPHQLPFPIRLKYKGEGKFKDSND